GQASPCKGLKGAAATACNGGFSNTSAPTNGSGSTQTGNNSNNLTCDLEFTNALTWAICPIVDALVKVVDLVDEQITDALTVNTASIFCTGSSASNSTCNAYYGAWQSFRNIALGLLAIAGLVILISQALGFEVLDAYTIKKALPRLLVAAIMITLSWPLMEFFVGFTNDLGFGIRHLIYAPFANIKANINLDFNGGITNILFGGAATGAAAVAAVPIWIAAGGIGVLLAYVATAALAVLVAFVVLVLRQVAIILLIIMAPVAIVCYILPNTERIYKFWWESFSKALLMFPLIAGFIAAGRVFSAVALQNSDNPVSGFLGFAAYFAPYFLIPATFKLAGGAIRQIGGFVNDRSRGGFDRLRQYRGNQAKNRVERARKGGLYRKDFGQFNRPFKRDAQGNRVKSSVGRVLNKVGDYTLDADEVVPMKLGSTTLGGALSRPGIPGFRRGAARDISLIDQARRDQTAKAFQEIDPGYKAGRLLAGEFGYYNDGLQAADRASLDENYGIKDGKGNITGYRNPDGYGERMQVAQMFSRSGNLEGREAAAELAAAAPVIEKFSQSAETARVDGRLLGLMAAAKDGRLEIDDIVNNHNRQMVSGMTPDQAIQETTMLQNLATQKRVSAARGHGIEYDENGRAYNVYKEAVDSKGNVIGGPLSEKAQNSLARVNSGELAQVKSEDIDAWAETMVAGASEYEMEMRKDAEGRSTGKVMFRGEGADKNDLVPKTGIAAQRAKEVQNRIKYLAQYSQGDSDVGRKIRGVWERIGGDPSALEWGTAR
ncbi:MAG TPA: hypothetical protein VLG27_02825, partial [Candidatus Saccharimonadia bacterium]|nr:hypothetical protein [Candidatus Saccharimonadia bacterium]